MVFEIDPLKEYTTNIKTAEFDCFTCTFPAWCTNSNNLPFWKQLIGDYCVVDFCLKCDKETILAQSITLLWDDKQTVNYKQPFWWLGRRWDEIAFVIGKQDNPAVAQEQG